MGAVQCSTETSTHFKQTGSCHIPGLIVTACVSTPVLSGTFVICSSFTLDLDQY